MEYNIKISASQKYDVAICGGGFSGFAAAYAAAREGLDTVIIERGSCLGGVGTSGLVNHILGIRNLENGKLTQCVGGIFTEIESRLKEIGGCIDVNSVDFDLCPHGWYPSLGTGLIFDAEKMKLLLEQMLIQKNVRILYLTDIIDAIKEEGKVSGVVVHNKSGLCIINADCFVDATGDADVCKMAGCLLHKGDEHGEMAAASLEMHVENVDHNKLTNYMRTTGDLRFRNIINRLKDNGEWDFPYEIFISVMLTQKDVFMINTIRQVGVDGTDGASLSRAITDGRAENFRLLEIMRKHFPGFENASVRHIANTVGIRETNRICGEYTLTVEDLIAARDFDDSVAVSGYSWDLPDPKHPSVQPYDGVKRKSVYTQIPYRCLVPAGVDNVIAAGRCISVEREVLGPVRVMGPCIAMGEAAGIAAKAIVQNGVAFKNVDYNYIRNKIKSYGGMVERPKGECL